MRHRVAHRKLGRVTEHRVAMLRNQATALIRYEHIETTVPKAKELRPFVERLITIAKRGVAAGRRQRQAPARAPPRRARAASTAKSSSSCSTRSRRGLPTGPGGYTRILRLGFRRGDSAEMAQLELRRQRVRSEGGAEADEVGGGKAESRRRRTSPRRGGSPPRQDLRGCRSGQQESRADGSDEGPIGETHDTSEGRLSSSQLGLRS